MDQDGRHERADGERYGRSVHLVGVLARAMTTQFDELARTGHPAPDGWWFADGDGGNGGDGAAGGAREAGRSDAGRSDEETR